MLSSHRASQRQSVKIASLDFGRVVREKAAWSAMLSFAESEFSDENLRFYDRAQSFRKKYMKRGSQIYLAEEYETMKADATKIIDTFLIPNAPHALNLPDDLLKRFHAGLPEECTSNMFDPVSRVVYRAIEHDTFWRFKLSQVAQDLLESVPSLSLQFSGSNKSRSSEHNSMGTHSSCSQC